MFVCSFQKNRFERPARGKRPVITSCPVSLRSTRDAIWCWNVPALVAASNFARHLNGRSVGRAPTDALVDVLLLNDGADRSLVQVRL